MKAMPTDDPLFGKGIIREDGRKIHPMYLLQVKTPAESKSEWDVFKISGTIPADKAFRPLAEGGCPLLRRTELSRAIAPSGLRGGLATQCLLWVKIAHVRRKKACPLYTRKRTCAVQTGMSALCQ